MRFRKLRIAFSGTCLIACMLLIVLWVRSYFVSDYITGTYTHAPGYWGIESEEGIVGVEWSPNPFGFLNANEWTLEHLPLDSEVPNQEFLGFHYETSQYGAAGRWETVLRFPIWLPVMLLVAAAIAPWVLTTPSRFSLRTLLTATTLVTVVLGLIAFFARWPAS